MEITGLGLQPTDTAVESQTNATIWSVSYLYNFHLLPMLFSDIIGAERGYDRTEYVSWGTDASITRSASSCLAYLTYSNLLLYYLTSLQLSIRKVALPRVCVCVTMPNIYTLVDKMCNVTCTSLFYSIYGWNLCYFPWLWKAQFSLSYPMVNPS